MAAIKKPEEAKQAATIPLRVTSAMKADLGEMARDTGVSTSERARQALEDVLKKWKKQSAWRESDCGGLIGKSEEKR